MPLAAVPGVRGAGCEQQLQSNYSVLAGRVLGASAQYCHYRGTVAGRQIAAGTSPQNRVSPRQRCVRQSSWLSEAPFLQMDWLCAGVSRLQVFSVPGTTATPGTVAVRLEALTA